MTTRRQHYVWQKYLEPWTTKKGKARQLWCLRREAEQAIFTDIKNVAVERDFYRLLDLHEGDSDFVRSLAFSPNTNPKLRELNQGWLSRFESFLELLQTARSHPKASQTLLATLDSQMIEFQEDAYGRMEDDAVSQLAALQEGDITFFDDDDQAISFSYFLAHQYFRTKAIRDRIRDTFPTQTQKDLFNRTWPVFRYIYATNVGYSIFAHRKTMKLQVLHAAPGIEFITADQPAINTHGAFMPGDTAIDDVELFYPVSPSRAAIISSHGIYQDSHGKPLEPFRMHYLNQAIERVAYECLFAQSESTLNSIAPHFCTHRKRVTRQPQPTPVRP